MTEPCWRFLVGASFGLGWQWRCGERDCVSIWPSASTSSHSCRYWRTVLTPALPSIHHSFPFMPPSASHLQTLESFLLILMACLPPTVNIHGKQTKWSYNSSVLSHSHMDGTRHWTTDFIQVLAGSGSQVFQSASFLSVYIFSFFYSLTVIILNIFCPPIWFLSFKPFNLLAGNLRLLQSP